MDNSFFDQVKNLIYLAFQYVIVYIIEGILFALFAVVTAIGYVYNSFPEALPGWLRAIIMFFGLVAISRAFWAWRDKVRLGGLTRDAPYGKSEWATRTELKAAGLLKREGLFLGTWRDGMRSADLYRSGDGHLLTIGAPGSGKTTGLVVPALLELKHGAVIVTDPKAQLAAITARHRKTMGEVYYLNPYVDELRQQTGIAIPDSGFNPIATLQPGYDLKDDAENLARLLMIQDREDSNSYWGDEAAGIMAALIYWMVKNEPQENRNLAYLWGMVRQDRQHIRQHLSWLKYSKDKFQQVEGARLYDLTTAEKQWQGVISKAQVATQRYAPNTPIGDHTARHGLDLSKIKREDITVYVIVPTGRIKTAAPWLNLVMGVLGREIGKPGEKRPVYMLMDEAPALGFLPDLRNFLRESREAGLRAWIFSQTRAALADPRLYGENGYDDIEGLCETRQFFAIREPKLAKDISELFGEKTALNRTTKERMKKDESDTFATLGVPLIRPNEVLRMRPPDQLILHGGLPIRAQLVPYWKRSTWRNRTDRNPYRGK
ncbi:type IV secretory system conjugative DNA transfer family protein [Jiella marina]|uniref:type IV secretory system conjugative DNA transfer family protein n=1 Tax=Jiella sp. LLJ827 TaxID=2917712 RepID=UPI002100B4FB|nr:type IV secretory system conjugative DNA transfer family protein [Jiella sp. LLJ827]MCQ0990606.1 type IV secretory system conjugative DNA transfer family protein [Jiella sp. LLJ827]